MKVLKFGGKSLSNGEGINKVITIISDKINQGEKIAVVVSARGNATDDLEALLETASQNGDYKTQFEDFKIYQQAEYSDVDLTKEFGKLNKLFEGVSLIGEYSQKVK